MKGGGQAKLFSVETRFFSRRLREKKELKVVVKAKIIAVNAASEKGVRKIANAVSSAFTKRYSFSGLKSRNGDSGHV